MTRKVQSAEGKLSDSVGAVAFRALGSTFFAPGRRSRRGFTLVEVLVSLGIFAVAVVVLGAAYVNVLVGYQTMKGRTTAQDDLAFARSQLMAEPVRETAEQGGQMRMSDNGNLRWTAEIDETDRADLFDVTIEYEISPNTGPLRRERQTFRLLRPTWSKIEKREELRAGFKKQLEKERAR